MEVALQWCTDTFSDLLVGFVNSVKTIDGGTHIEGFKVCHSNNLSSHARLEKSLIFRPTLIWRLYSDGLVLAGVHRRLTLCMCCSLQRR